MRSLSPWPIFPQNLEAPVARSLSLQFTIQTLMDGFDRLRNLHQFVSFQLQGADLKQEFFYTIQELENFVLFSVENPFAQRGSILDNLYFYSEILIQASLLNEQELPQILEGMVCRILKTKSKITTWKKMKPPYPLETIRAEMFTLHAYLEKKLQNFFLSLSKYLKEARSDENVMIKLIEHKDQLNASIGKRYIENLLQSFFPLGHSQLRAVIHEGYTRRGFIQFLSKVEPLVDAIEWDDTPCDSQAIS